MQRGADSSTGGLGPQLVGERIHVNRRIILVERQLGEGGFSFVYLVKDISSGEEDSNTSHNNSNITESITSSTDHHVLKITSIHSRQQRDIAEKEAKLLSRLSHPSIVRMLDSCYRTIPAPIPDEIQPRSGGGKQQLKYSSRPQHLILMEYCEGGTALSVCNRLKNSQKMFDIQSLIIAFGQICNAVSYLHAQRPPIVHRDLKPVNFLVKNGAYKLCDFGSAVFGHVDLRTSRARAEAEEVIEKTTTQMFRSPEMVDLYVSKKLTQSTDVWALGCCLYSLAFLQNCFEEGSNLAILSRNYKIPDNNPYGPKLAELIDRMLTVNSNERADMTEVILCLSAIYSGRPLPPRRKKSKSAKGGGSKNAQKKERVGTYRTDGQGIREKKSEEKKPVEAKKLNPNSAAARRRKAAQTGVAEGGSVPLTRTASKLKKPAPSANVFDQSFSDAFTFTSDNGSAAFDNGGSAFSGTDDPFHVGDTFGAFKDDYESSELSQDGVFDFVSDNGSGFDTFGSEDGSRNQGFTDRSLQNAVTKANKDYSGEVDNLNFDNLRVAEDDGDINRDYDKSISSSGDMKKKKKGIKGFFRRDNNEVEI